ncbi:androgen-dependent TFPI-regulating protein [Heteronotia binoei]|uniref:androgen-dependent TFPI-regulating protein n=1 Tax=Heteronotia binoei TaxID=13085 RepID=UPI0029308293|nr:androgen-dependent TFPI-regulating protein [Heteronotia binoei]
MQPSGALWWHGLAFAWFAYVAATASRIGKNDGAPPELDAHGGPWKFLTFLNLVLQATLFGVSLLGDVFVLMKKRRIAKFVLPFRDLLFGSLGFPASVFVFTFFWMLYFYDRQLVYPKYLDAVIPVWLNHAMHSSIFPFALIELCFIPHRYPSKEKRLGLLGIGCLAYISWILHIYQISGKWVYPVFHALNQLGIAAFFLGAFGVLVLYSHMGAFLCRMIWGDTVVIFDTSKKKSK